MNWDLYRIFQIVHRERTLKRAGAQLGMSSATVGRKIAELEAVLGTELFIKSPSGYEMSVAGAAMAQALAEDLEALNALDFKAKQACQIEKESIDISTIESLAVHWLPRIIADYLHESEGVSISIRSEYELYDPRADRADIIMRVADTAPTDLIGACIENFTFVLFAQEVPQYRVLYEGAIGATQFGKTANSLQDVALPSFHCDSISMALEIARNLPVRVWLPSFLAASIPGLTPQTTTRKIEAPLWILRRPASRNESHIKPLFKLIVEAAQDTLS